MTTSHQTRESNKQDNLQILNGCFGSEVFKLQCCILKLAALQWCKEDVPPCSMPWYLSNTKSQIEALLYLFSLAIPVAASALPVAYFCIKQHMSMFWMKWAHFIYKYVFNKNICLSIYKEQNMYILLAFENKWLGAEHYWNSCPAQPVVSPKSSFKLHHISLQCIKSPQIA